MTTAPLTVSNPLPCIQCGYDLVGLAISGKCPECGTPVDRSMRGDLLKYSSPQYRGSLLRGVTLIMTGIALMLIGMIGALLIGAFVPGAGGQIVMIGLMFLSSAASFAGYFLYSVPDPGQLSANKGETPRRVLRICIAISLASSLAQTVVSMIATGKGVAGFGMVPHQNISTLTMFYAITAVTGLIAGAVQFFAAMLYTRWLAPRIPSTRVANRAKLLMWLGPILIVLYCTLICPLIALILYYNMFSWIRSALISLRDAPET
ncbi:MAG: hypothetical protein U0573_02355 [Phycisphaerales bacterium]|nr:hypothetical protein [Planctomycetota bacterium]